MRILIGGQEIAGWVNNYAKGFKVLGHEVTTFVHEKKDYFSSEEYSYVLNEIKPLSRINIIKKYRYQLFTEEIIERHDVFIFLWAGQCLSDDFKDYSIIKKKGKKIITVCVGSDVRYWPALLLEYPYLNPGIDFLMKWKKSHYLKKRFLDTVESLEKYSDVILSVPDQSSLFTRPYYHLQIPLDISKYPFKPKNNNKIKILHLPSSNYKGSELIIKALDKYKNTSNVEVFLPPKMSNTDFIKLLTETDILIDEIIYPGPGMQGMEAIATGTILLTKHQEGMCSKFKPPLLNINNHNLSEKIEEAIDSKSIWSDKRKEGRMYIEQFNDCKIVAQSLLDILDGKIKPDYYPEFYKENKSRIPNSMIEFLDNYNI